MGGKAVVEVANLTRAAMEPREIHGEFFAPTEYTQIIEQVFTPATLQVSTLSGLIGYVEANRDELDLETLMVHVATPTRVELISALEAVRQKRMVYVAAVAETVEVTGAWLTPGFTITVSTGCVPGVGDIDKVIKIAGNVRRDQHVELKDDGMSQAVQQRAGVTLVERADVPNPVTLAPYRTFREVEQVPSPFMLRFDASDERIGVRCRLFESDGGVWQIVARARIAVWLRKQLPKEVVVIA